MVSPRPGSISAPPVGLDSASVMVSIPSGSPSSKIGTVIVRLPPSPFAQLSVPATA